MNRFLHVACIVASAAGLVAQQGDGGVAVAEAQLVAAQKWSMQGDPIRFTLRLAAVGGDARVRVASTNSPSWLHPFVVEREIAGAWRAVQPRPAAGDAEPRPLSARQRQLLRNPSRLLTGSAGRVLKEGSTVDLEADLWRVQALALAGKLRVRMLLQTLVPGDQREWQDVSMPWTAITIYGHAGNAAGLLGEDNAELATRFEVLCAALNKTMRTSRNSGPVNVGPAGPLRGSPNRWGPHLQTCIDLLADPDLSPRVHARARLVRIYHCIEEVRCGRDRDQSDLRQARADLASPELSNPAPGNGLAALPSGGFEPMRLLLDAWLDAEPDREAYRESMAEILEAYPFFNYWWGYEARSLLQR